MLKVVQVLLLLCLPLGVTAQKKAITVGYFGEMLTHPGIKVGLDYTLKTKEILRVRKGESKAFTRSYHLQPSLGVFYHRRYQTGVFASMEFGKTRQNSKGKFFGYGLHLGYLTTAVPNTYVLNEGGTMERKFSGHHYLWPGLSCTIGKDFSKAETTSFAWYLKPQFRYAVPNFPTGVGYFIVETGIRYPIK